MIVRNILNFIGRRSSFSKFFFAVDNGFANESKGFYFQGNRTNFVLAEPLPGCSLVVKGVTILGDGNQGEVFVLRQSPDPERNVLLPAFFSAQNRAGASGALNIKLETDEKILLTTTNRGTSNTFVGVSFVCLDNGGDLD